MEKIKIFIRKVRIPLGVFPSVFIICFASLITAFAMFFIAPESMSIFLAHISDAPLLFFLNFLPTILAMVTIYFISANAILSSCIISIVSIIFAIINRVKVQMRQDPFIPTDLALANEATSVLKAFDQKYIILAIAAVAVLVLALVLSFLLFKGKGLSKKIRILGTAISIALGCILGFTVYSNDELYNSFSVDGNVYFKVNQYVSKGFLYSFLYDCHSLKIQTPADYDKNLYLQLEQPKNLSAYAKKEKPNIIMVMGEAYSDISETDTINFDGYENPTKFFNEIKRDPNAITGHIIVPNFGGGTSDTEFDVLSACPSRFTGNPQASYSFIRKKFEALPWLLKDIGYDTLAIHPGFSWFYNRSNVYKNIGFDDFLYLEKDFDAKTQSKGGYISETSTIDSILNSFEEHKKNKDNPLFTFCVTIQNHGPYGEKYDNLETNFNSSLPLSDEEYAIYSGYFQGIKDADSEMQRMVEYFSNSDEPVVLVYFGDHLPGFSNGMDFFDKLDPEININGTTEQRLNAYKTPFFIWQNESAKNLVDITAAATALPDNNTINASFLGSTLMELLGMGDISPLFEFSNSLRSKIPIVTNSSFMDINGNYFETPKADDQDDIDKLHGWVHYKLFDQDLK